MPATQELPRGADEQSPASWLSRFWHRYSPYGEFPISSGVSIALHITAVVVLALGLGVLVNHTERPPAVSSVRVGTDDTVAPGFGEDGLPPGDGTLETGSAAGPAGNSGVGGEATVPEVKEAEKVNEVKTDAPKETFIAPTPGEQIKRSEDEDKANRNRSGSRLKDAEAIIKGNQGKGGGGANGPGGGKGDGGGGGNDLAGRAAKQARWILKFESKSTQDYLAQFEGLGAEIAFAAEGNKWKFFPRPATNPSLSNLRTLANENRLYWIDDKPQNVTSAAAALGVSGSEMIMFLPLDLEKRMLEMELSYRKRQPEQIQTTTFGVTRSGGEYDVIVLDQVAR